MMTDKAWNLSHRTMMLPRDTNGHGSIFGGVILSQIDLAASIEAQKAGAERVATVCMREVIFKNPVKLNAVVSCYTRVKSSGRTSITIEVDVRQHDDNYPQSEAPVTHAEVVMVAINAQGLPVPTVWKVSEA